MEFIHRPYIPGETIAAIATPPGEGGISIIRISGTEALAVANRVFSGSVESYASHTAHLGRVVGPGGAFIDEALVLVMRAPRSYTGEDIVELQCHGGMIASKKVLEACLAAGARPAGPGEFTFKAFMNGKLDLTQAEAIQKLIGAKNEEAFQAAGKHLKGKLTQKIQSFQTELVRCAAILEAWVDFPDEDLEFISSASLVQQLQEIQKAMEHLRATFHDGKKIEHGIELCLAGAPNAGKSSLMNALLMQERAIVTPIAGTTRDLVREEMTLGGVHFRVTDTAGVRETEEIVEKEGIKRTLKAIEEADLVLFVLDSSKAFGEEEKEMMNRLPKEKTLAIWNKSDLPAVSQAPTHFVRDFSISAKEGTGIEELRQALYSLIWERGAPPKEEVVITSLRHYQALDESIQYLQEVIMGLNEGLSPEFLNMDIRAALKSLGLIIGTNIGEDILSSIFSQFCIGK